MDSKKMSKIIANTVVEYVYAVNDHKTPKRKDEKKRTS